MSLTPAMIDAMVASGCTAEQMAAVMKAALADRDEKVAEKRAKDAERQRKSRVNRGLSRDVTVTECDERDTAPFPAPAPFLPPDPQQTPTPTHTPVLGTPARKGTRLAEDWKPEPVIGNAGSMVENWPPGTLERELEKFRNYWLAKSGKDAAKTNWQRTWINWLMTADERIGRNGTGNRNSAAGRGSVSEALHAARDRLGYS